MLLRDPKKLFRGAGDVGLQQFLWPAPQWSTGHPKPMFSLRKWWFFRFGSIPRELLVPPWFLRVADALRGMHFDLPEAPFLVQDGVLEA